MRTKLASITLLIAVLAACGSSGPASTANPPASNGPAATGQPTTPPAGNGKVDCAVIKAAGVQLLSIQILAQLRDADAIESVKTKQFGNLDVDAFLAAMHQLHALDSYSSALGDPKAAIDVYEKAATAAKTLFATTPMTQAAIDAYNANVGTVADFLGHQVAIAGAMDAAGC